MKKDNNDMTLLNIPTTPVGETVPSPKIMQPEAPTPTPNTIKDKIAIVGKNYGAVQSLLRYYWKSVDTLTIKQLKVIDRLYSQLVSQEGVAKLPEGFDPEANLGLTHSVTNLQLVSYIKGWDGSATLHECLYRFDMITDDTAAEGIGLWTGGNSTFGSVPPGSTSGNSYSVVMGDECLLYAGEVLPTIKSISRTYTT